MQNPMLAMPPVNPPGGPAAVSLPFLVSRIVTPVAARVRPRSLPEPVSHAAHVLRDRRAELAELHAQPREMRLQPLRIGIALVGPAGAQQLLAGDDVAAAAHEDLEQPELDRREIERLPVSCRAVP